MEDNTRKSCVTFIRLCKLNKKKTFLHVHGNNSCSDADYDAGTLLLAIYPRKTSHKEILYQRRGVS